MAIMAFTQPLILPDIPVLIIGIVCMGVLYTLIGIVLIVRYDKITDFLMPMAIWATVLTLPFVYFLGWAPFDIFLLIPTSAPTVIMQGAYLELEPWKWVYAIGYTTILLVGLTIWAHRAFEHHIVQKGG